MRKKACMFGVHRDQPRDRLGLFSPGTNDRRPGCGSLLRQGLVTFLYAMSFKLRSVQLQA
jgi:hypothetical protein